MCLKVRLRMSILGVLILLFPQSLQAAECEGVTYPETVLLGGQTLVLNGLGMRESLKTHEPVYVAALYVVEKSDSEAKILSLDNPKILEMTFVRDVNKSTVMRAYLASFNKVPKEEQAKLKPGFDQLMAWMSEISKGQKQMFTFVPGKGVTVMTKGKIHGTIHGDEFATFLLKVWLGPNPPKPALKLGLLGGKCG